MNDDNDAIYIRFPGLIKLLKEYPDGNIPPEILKKAVETFRFESGMFKTESNQTQH